MSAIDCSKDFMTIGRSFVRKCPNLRTFIAPALTWFNASNESEPSFNTTNLSEIQLGSFVNCTYTPMFRFTPIDDVKEFTPNAYLALTRNRELDKKRSASMPLRNLFEGMNGAKVRPV